MQATLTVDKIEELSERNAAGVSWRSLAEEAGLWHYTLIRWAKHLRAYGPGALEQVIHIPVEPLEAFIRNGGGLDMMLPGLRRLGEVRVDGEWIERLIVTRTPEERAFLAATNQRLNEARAQGYVDYYIADDIACTALGTHPSAIYGSAWFEFPQTHCVGIQTIKQNTQKEVA